jgi:hypothetical protein
MASMERIGSNGTRALGAAVAALGVAMVVRTIAAGGGVASIGVLLGIVFMAIGLGRIYLSTRTQR